MSATVESQIQFRADLFQKEVEGLEGTPLTDRERDLLTRQAEAIVNFVIPQEYVVVRNGRIVKESPNVTVVNMDTYHELDENDVVDFAIELDDLDLRAEAFEIREYFGFLNLPND